MYARALDMLHNAGNEYILAVAYRVHLDFRAHDVLVYKHDIIGIAVEYDGHVFFYVLVRERYYHVLSAEHVGRAQQYGIAERVARRERLLRRLDGVTLRASNAQLFEQCVKPFSVLRRVDRVRGRAEYSHAFFGQVLGKFDCRLPAERNDYAVRTFGSYYVVHVLFG